MGLRDWLTRGTRRPRADEGAADPLREALPTPPDPEPPDVDTAGSSQDTTPAVVGPWTVVRVAASVLAPITLITALMYYFGLIHAYWFFGSFGVDYSVFNLSPEDYILRSADGLFVPFSVAALLVLLLAWTYQLVAQRVRRRLSARVVDLLTVAGSVVGLALLGIAACAVWRPARFVDAPALGGLALVVGVLLLTAATRALRRRLARVSGPATGHPPVAWSVAEWTSVVVLVSVGLFWAVGDWSATVGSRRGQDVLRALPSWPSVIVYSERSLSLDAVGVTETACSGVDTAFGYRYDGLTLITQEGGQLLLLPRHWTPDTGTAVVLTASDSLRLDFRPTTTAGVPTC